MTLAYFAQIERYFFSKFFEKFPEQAVKYTRLFECCLRKEMCRGSVYSQLSGLGFRKSVPARNLYNMLRTEGALLPYVVNEGVEYGESHSMRSSSSPYFFFRRGLFYNRSLCAESTALDEPLMWRICGVCATLVNLYFTKCDS